MTNLEMEKNETVKMEAKTLFENFDKSLKSQYDEMWVDGLAYWIDENEKKRKEIHH